SSCLSLSQTSSSPNNLYLTLPLLLPYIFFKPPSRTSPQEYYGVSTSIESFRIMIFRVSDIGVLGLVLVKLPGLSLKFDFLATLRLGCPM
ncbi:hypothetical protein GIB67_042659, partial [Kingdonia uniflora]